MVRGAVRGTGRRALAADGPTYAHFTLGPAQFALGQYRPVPARGARFNFEVDDVDAWWDRVGADADVVEPLFDTPYGTRKFTIRDPDGNELGFVRAQVSGTSSR